MEDQHFICIGGCKGVSDTPGTCQAETCLLYNNDLQRCECADGAHNGAHDEA